MNKPIKTYKAGTLALYLWENINNDKINHTITFEKSYKTKDDKWEKTQSLNKYDIPKLRVMLDLAYKEIILKK